MISPSDSATVQRIRSLLPILDLNRPRWDASEDPIRPTYLNRLRNFFNKDGTPHLQDTVDRRDLYVEVAGEREKLPTWPWWYCQAASDALVDRKECTRKGDEMLACGRVSRVLHFFRTRELS